jgi:hypothetical protein
VGAGPVSAQAKAPRAAVTREDRGDLPKKSGEKADAKKAKKDTPASPKTGGVRVSATPTPPSAVTTPATPLAALWKRMTEELGNAYAARYPDRALRAGGKESAKVKLGTFGSSATLQWREALTNALADLERFERAAKNGPKPAPRQALLRRLAEWLESELVLLDGLSPSTKSPADYVARARSTLRAAYEAPRPELRAEFVARLLAELPDYLRDARISLIAPAPRAIDLALLELDDLDELLVELVPLAATAPRAKALGPRKPAAAPPTDPRASVQAFRNWLLDLGTRAGGEPPRLEADEWLRLVALASGTPCDANELKVRCLRELGRLELARGEGRARKALSDPEGIPERVEAAAKTALRVAQEARVVRKSLDPKRLEFAVEPSLRTETDMVRLARRGGAEATRACVALANPSWPLLRSQTRCATLRLEDQAALGVRHGLVGEGLFALVAQHEKSAPRLLLDDNELTRGGLGLFALEWIQRLETEKVQNPFRDAARYGRAFERQLGFAAARFLAALELHAEGLSLGAASQAFARRTGCDARTAESEVLAAERDPRCGFEYLGFLELGRLEERLGALVGPRKALRVTLLLVTRSPELRPADLVPGIRAEKRADRKDAGALEKPGEPQHEVPRSR